MWVQVYRGQAWVRSDYVRTIVSFTTSSCLEHNHPFKALVRAAGDNEQWLKMLCFTSSKEDH